MLVKWVANGIVFSFFFPDFMVRQTEDPDAPPPKYHHVMIPGNRDRDESYLTLAMEAALIGGCVVCGLSVSKTILTHWGLVTPFGHIDLGLHRLR